MTIVRNWLMNGVLLGGLVGFFVGCGAAEREELTKRVSEANDKVLACKAEVTELKNQVGALKKQLAEAMSNPSRVVLTDPEIIELVASIKGSKGGGNVGEEVALGKGALDPKAASKVVMGNAQALQMCYERALKKNAALQMHAGLPVTLAITVKGSGTVEAVDVKPAVDKDMVGCMNSVITRWKFPTFAGDPVTIEQKLTLKPQT